MYEEFFCKQKVLQQISCSPAPCIADSAPYKGWFHREHATVYPSRHDTQQRILRRYRPGDLLSGYPPIQRLTNSEIHQFRVALEFEARDLNEVASKIITAAIFKDWKNYWLYSRDLQTQSLSFTRWQP